MEEKKSTSVKIPKLKLALPKGADTDATSRELEVRSLFASDYYSQEREYRKAYQDKELHVYTLLLIFSIMLDPT